MTPLEQFEADHAQDRLTAYSLNQRSIVFDIGGYEGQWTYDLLKRGAGVCEHCGAKQDPHVYIFEPVQMFYDTCVNRFQEYPKVRCLNFGLSNYTHEAFLRIDGASTKECAASPFRTTVRDITEFIYENGISQIDLMSINIEGEEYALLDRIIRSGVIKNTENVQVQFHDFVPEAIEKRAALQEQLSQTHVQLWGYSFVWEVWQRRC